MRWTGLIDHNWKNPGNWVEVKNNYESPVAWAPTGCVDVIIPSGATNYPELTDSVWCSHIAMKDRAMLKNPHVLNYDKATVELKLTPSEKDRVIMWSAPLQHMYSGDYHFKKNDGKPNWGDAYMMFFQMANPDVGNVAQANSMTATVGHPGVPLPLGTAFNFRLAATSINQDSTLIFPKAETAYTASNNASYNNLDRTNRSRFITDPVSVTSGGTFNLLVQNSAGTTVYPKVLQVVNPYMAYLDIQKFLVGNSTVLETNGYVAWDGDMNTSFVAHYTDEVMEHGIRWMTTFQAAPATNVGMIPPLKSFFVIRKDHIANPAAATNTLKMSPDWTTTQNVTNPYTLRASTTETNVLRIKATQGTKTSSALLYYNPQAHAYYNGKEDVYQLFYDEIPLTVYAITPWKEALAIYSDGDFSTRNTVLGLRVREAGEVTLTFSGMPTFGHDVWLIDKATGKEIDLQQNDSYAFTVVKTGSDAIDINDRFVLRAHYTGNGITGNEAPTLPQWNVSSRDRYIHIQSTSLLINQLQVYDITGALIYSANTPSGYFRIPVTQGIYIIKAQIGDEHKVEKVFVK
jgi:hypothetical protein